MEANVVLEAFGKSRHPALHVDIAKARYDWYYIFCVQCQDKIWVKKTMLRPADFTVLTFWDIQMEKVVNLHNGIMTFDLHGCKQ